jgi:hypothetical protein
MVWSVRTDPPNSRDPRIVSAPPVSVSSVQRWQPRTDVHVSVRPCGIALYLRLSVVQWKRLHASGSACTFQFWDFALQELSISHQNASSPHILRHSMDRLRDCHVSTGVDLRLAVGGAQR